MRQRHITTSSTRRAGGGRMGADAPTQTGRFEDALLPLVISEIWAANILTALLIYPKS